MQTKNQPDQPKNRSPRFPFTPLRKALEHVRTLHKEFGVEPVGAPRAVKAMGFDALSGKAYRVLAALKAYGLITRVHEQGAQIRVSASGAKLAADPEGADLSSLRLAALEPRPFRRIWHNRPGVTEEELAHILEQRRFTEQGAKRAARVYTANVRFAQLEDPAFRNSNEAPPLPSHMGRGQAAAAAVVETGGPGKPGVPQRLRIPLGPDFATIPMGMSLEEFQLLMQTLRLWKSQIIAA